MAKKVIKELAIILLLCVAIILVLGLLFYKYIPTNKIVPNKVAYEMPQNIAEEIQNDVDESTFVNITYSLDASEINQSKRAKQYSPGKANPFESIKTENTANGNTASGNNTNTNTNTNTSANTTTSNQNSSGSGEFIPSGGAK